MAESASMRSGIPPYARKTSNFPKGKDRRGSPVSASAGCHILTSTSLNIRLLLACIAPGSGGALG